MAQRKRRAVPLFQIMAAALGLLALSTVVMPSWAGELAASWMPHIAIGLLVMALAALFLGRRIWSLVQTALAAALLVAMVPAGAESAQAMARFGAGLEGERLRLVFANVNIDNDRVEALGRWVAEQQPDVVVLTEVLPGHMAALETALADWPHWLKEPRGHAFGQVIASRLPLLTRRTIPLDGGAWQSPIPVMAAVTVPLGEGSLRVVGFHPYPPLLPGTAPERNAQFVQAAGVVDAMTGPMVVTGDFNATAWSPALRDFAAGTGLTGYNIAATWPVQLGFAGIAIDHALVSDGVAITALATGPDLGSDHRAIVVDLVVRAAD